MTGALFRKLKREVRAARALLWTPGWVAPDLVSMWFMPQQAADVTRHAALAEECLDDARAHAKRKGRSLPPLEYLPSGILESEAMEPYLKRWKRGCCPAGGDRRTGSGGRSTAGRTAGPGPLPPGRWTTGQTLGHRPNPWPLVNRGPSHHRGAGPGPGRCCGCRGRRGGDHWPNG